MEKSSRSTVQENVVWNIRVSVTDDIPSFRKQVHALIIILFENKTISKHPQNTISSRASTIFCTDTVGLHAKLGQENIQKIVR